MNQPALSKAKPFRSAVSAEAVLDTLVTATVVLDTDLKVVFVNSAAESLLHCSATQEGKNVKTETIRTNKGCGSTH